MIMNRCVSRGETDGPIIDEIMRDMRLICCHRIDLPWWLSFPAAEAGRNVGIWDDAQRPVPLLGAAKGSGMSRKAEPRPYLKVDREGQPYYTRFALHSREAAVGAALW